MLLMLLYDTLGTSSSSCPTETTDAPNMLPVMTKQPQLRWGEVRQRAGGVLIKDESVLAWSSADECWRLVAARDELVVDTDLIDSATNSLRVRLIRVPVEADVFALPQASAVGAQPPHAQTAAVASAASTAQSARRTRSNPSRASGSPPPAADTDILLQEAADAARKMSTLLGATLSSWAKQASETAHLASEMAQQRIQHEDAVGGIRVRMGKRLAEGGFSEVLHCRNVATNEALALKRCRAQTREQLEQFRREIAAHRALADEPHVLKLLASDETPVPGSGSGRCTVRLLFPLCEGGSWHDRAWGSSSTTSTSSTSEEVEGEALRLFVGVARGLEAVHRAGLLHRDVKPHNVLLTSEGHPLLMDLGSVCVKPIKVPDRAAAAAIVEEAAELSSAPYRSPELHEPTVGSDIGPELDVWSLGATLYAVTYGRGYSPFEDPTHGVLKLAILNGTPIRFPQRTPFSKELQGVVLAALRRDPRTRVSLSDLAAMAQCLL